CARDTFGSGFDYW
nr:immunoglobulin heavy chain junction region [Macaca mulatta]MOX92965.1 immunoglobulin heavy chain junction region [Macaca mulatta]MOX93062.1 immunoglobulin heavy chain junction region [Macaca mulatta]MOX93213.1 immunoglobulin heavy chain junction region [Macaca mulatta]MOX93396.1 immunoglobulin heavy chain junction region [Macaca mulatta]